MQKLSAFAFVALALALSAVSTLANTGNIPSAAMGAENEKATKQIVETVDIQGNRRLRDDDLIYYIKTRPGDTYEPAALARPSRLLSLTFLIRPQLAC